ncbi:hypothetical protein V8G54_022841 [Vigna mungo]|uniref:Uncharacterized protein n=1 Tax=Vigna mungo TaxID=3915 RepID=A0AAQ3N3T0_VIGMU
MIFRTKKKLYITYTFFQNLTFLFLTISITILRNKFAGPQDHLCCWNLKALKVLGSSLFAWRSPRYKNFHPLRLARTARSISSTVVLSFHPPASLIAAILQIPAVPLKPKKA